jgi:hypothetical protein
MSRGLSLGAFIIAFVLAGMTLGATGYYATTGVDISTGYSDNVNKTVGDLEHPEAQGVGTSDPGFFGIAVGIWKTLTTLLSLTYKTQSILKTYGVHWSIAYSIQVMVNFAVAITLIEVYRGYNAR